MRKILSAIMAVFVLVLCLASCSAGTPTGTDTGTITKATVTGSYDEDSSADVTFSSTDFGAGTAGITLSGACVIDSDVTITGGTWESTEGNQAVFLVVDGSSLTISNAVFSGADATITVSDTTITNTGSGNSRGLHATYGGTINASGMTISTTGNDFPCLYSTGEIKADCLHLR